MILVMGATGNVGSQITQHLIDNGHEVRCLARYFSEDFRNRNIECITGDANSVSVVSKAMQGCSAAFTMIPSSKTAPDVRVFQSKMGEVIAAAIEESGVRKIVNLSAAGADLTEGTGPILGHHDQELRLNSLPDVDIVHLRPVAFMENLIQHIPLLLNRGQFFGVAPRDQDYNMIATRDIAARAAFLLMNQAFKGHRVEPLLGERPISYSDIIRILRRVLSQPQLDYTEVPMIAMQNALFSLGCSLDFARSVMQLEQSLANGDIQKTYQRDKVNTTATSFEDFARTTFLQAYTQVWIEHRASYNNEPERHSFYL